MKGVLFVISARQFYLILYKCVACQFVMILYPAQVRLNTHAVEQINSVA